MNRPSKTLISNRPLAPRQARQLRNLLENLYEQHHHPAFLAQDPLIFAHRYSEPHDRELVALLAAIFASGNIKAIQSFLHALLDRLGANPSQLVKETSGEAWQGYFDGLGHRWVRPVDLERLFSLIGATIRLHGSLGALFKRFDTERSSIEIAHGAMVAAILSADGNRDGGRVRQVTRHDGKTHQLPQIASILLTSPKGGSACKRMNLFFRWVVRPADGIDLGLWTEFVSPSRLMMPVDVHVLRFCQEHGLTTRQHPDRRAMLEITAAMQQICPEDPLRFDFSIVRDGVESLAGKRAGKVSP